MPRWLIVPLTILALLPACATTPSLRVMSEPGAREINDGAVLRIKLRKVQSAGNIREKANFDKN